MILIHLRVKAKQKYYFTGITQLSVIYNTTAGLIQYTAIQRH